MFIKEISIENFRNIQSVNIFPSKRINFFIGENGQGKSNLLEAIYANIRGKSFRTYSVRKDWIPNGSHNTRTQIRLKSEDNLGFENDFALGSELKSSLIWKFTINQKASSPKSFKNRISAIVFSPDDHELIRGPAEKRREFLDDLLCDICPGYEEVLYRFEKALKERNKIIRLLKTQDPLKTPSWSSEIETWSQILSKEAFQLVMLRKELWPQLESRFSRVALERGGFSDQIVRAHYHADGFGRIIENKTTPRAQDFYEALKNSFSTDMATGWTHRGPHRDDIQIVFGDLDGKTQASQGQSRVLAFLLKWMHAEWVKDVQNEYPILLLDDFSSELDKHRRAQLLELITRTEGQVFLTATELLSVDFSSLSEYTYFKVQKGNFIQEKPVL